MAAAPFCSPAAAHHRGEKTVPPYIHWRGRRVEKNGTCHWHPEVAVLRHVAREPDGRLVRALGDGREALLGVLRAQVEDAEARLERRDGALVHLDVLPVELDDDVRGHTVCFCFFTGCPVRRRRQTPLGAARRAGA